LVPIGIFPERMTRRPLKSCWETNCECSRRLFLFSDADDINEVIRQHENGFQPISSAFRAEGEFVVVNLVVKNADGRALKDAIVTIGANLAFRPETLGATVCSPTEVSYDKQTIEPFKHAGLENYYALRFPITQPRTRICIWGLVQSKRMRPYLAVGCVS
jgi:hypothetical protein